MCAVVPAPGRIRRPGLGERNRNNEDISSGVLYCMCGVMEVMESSRRPEQ